MAMIKYSDEVLYPVSIDKYKGKCNYCNILTLKCMTKTRGVLP